MSLPASGIVIIARIPKGAISSACVDIHSRMLKAMGEPDERIFTIGAWRETALVLSIATINVWNRLNAATRQITGEWVAELVAAQTAGAPA